MVRVRISFEYQSPPHHEACAERVFFSCKNVPFSPYRVSDRSLMLEYGFRGVFKDHDTGPLLLNNWCEIIPVSKDLSAD